MMNITSPHGNQSATSPRARKFRDQLTLIAAATSLEDIADDLAEGRTVKALHALRELSDWVIDTMREGLADHLALSGYRPVFELDAALHANRRTVLEKRARASGWEAAWDGEAFTACDLETGFILTVDPADNWRLMVDGPDLLAADSGLTALLFALNRNTLAEEVARL